MSISTSLTRQEIEEMAIRLDGRPVPGVRLEAEEFSGWCEEIGEAIRAEWVRGEVVLMAPAGLDHEEWVAWLIKVLGVYVDANDLGHVVGSNYLATLGESARLPDVMFISKAREHLLRSRALEGAPDLAIEVISPDSRNRDRREKFAEYETGGVQEYWILDPLLKRVDAYWRNASGKFERIAEAEGKLGSKIVRGFYLRVEWLHGPVLPNTLKALREMGAV